MLFHSGKDFVTSLTSEQRTSLVKKSDAKALKQLAWHISTLLFTSAYILLKVPGWPLVVPVQGVLLVFLFCLQHEVSHDTVFTSGRVNRFIAMICGFLLVLPPAWFRYFHLAHHRYTQQPDKDPELETAKPVTLHQYLWHVSGTPLWSSLLRTLWLNAMGLPNYPYVPASANTRLRTEARLMLLGYLLVSGVSILVASAQVLWLWVLPVLLGQPFLRLFLLAEHDRCPFVKNMFENTRTTYTTRLVRKLTWNMSFHAEHHVFPNVPFHQLPTLNQLTQKHLKVTSAGYLQFSLDSVQGRRKIHTSDL